jgi:uncharacterized membrane protein YkvA (DUF1232 family)
MGLTLQNNGFSTPDRLKTICDYEYVERSSHMKLVSKLIQQFVRNNIRNPKYRWALIVGSLLYLVSPLDFAPDFMPVLGWLDDGMVITLLASELSQFLIERRNAGKGETVTASAQTVDTTVLG